MKENINKMKHRKHRLSFHLLDKEIDTSKVKKIKKLTMSTSKILNPAKT